MELHFWQNSLQSGQTEHGHGSISFQQLLAKPPLGALKLVLRRSAFYLLINFCPNLLCNSLQEDEWGRARVSHQWGDDEETLREAMDMCPVNCIYFVS